ncbi:MAG: hypothetical protein QNJ81_06775 [Acidimicrobiia bacterium]|nr:hypothetical protein [Acidimicrobiia bacterium]
MAQPIMLRLDEMFGSKNVNALPVLREDTVYLCGRCRIMRYTAVQVEGEFGRKRCPTCGETMLSVNHETGRQILCKTLFEPHQDNPLRQLIRYGKEKTRTVVARIVRRDVGQLAADFQAKGLDGLTTISTTVYHKEIEQDGQPKPPGK